MIEPDLPQPGLPQPHRPHMARRKGLPATGLPHLRSLPSHRRFPRRCRRHRRSPIR
jgi:hypothetical protein